MYGHFCLAKVSTAPSGNRGLAERFILIEPTRYFEGESFEGYIARHRILEFSRSHTTQCSRPDPNAQGKGRGRVSKEPMTIIQFRPASSTYWNVVAQSGKPDSPNELAPPVVNERANWGVFVFAWQTTNYATTSACSTNTTMVTLYVHLRVAVARWQIDMRISFGVVRLLLPVFPVRNYREFTFPLQAAKTRKVGTQQTCLYVEASIQQCPRTHPHQLRNHPLIVLRGACAVTDASSEIY
ncbi:hypothetical protein FA15DRAFT_660418 [Coprinopsis marcescibilis]|uniref:Uncharacterized protein n=1 Tax=Coprinopsis marcescibilis TaxID=230819 RepID=A0A5C3KGA8_COPMA|nr:hypothetical protein FA15DRAFT_660418 [Coprinopsis marcescibilis]